LGRCFRSACNSGGIDVMKDIERSIPVTIWGFVSIGG
jgi:hypothetical protein